MTNWNEIRDKSKLFTHVNTERESLFLFQRSSLAYMGSPQAWEKIFVFSGDIAYDLHTENGIGGDNFTRQMEPVIAYVPYMVIAGNHEDDLKNFSNYKNRFVMPDNGYGDNQFYSFDLGPIHFLGVSTEYYGFFNEYGHMPVINQYNWLENDLKQADANRAAVPWILSYQHRPFYCSNENSEECTSFENTLIKSGFEDLPGLESLYLKYGMDLGFWGHEHSYERFWPSSGRQIFNQTSNPYHNAAAPTYIVTGAAGCHSGHALFENPPSPASASRINDYGYTMLHVVNKTHLFIEQISVEAGNQVVDQIWLSKDLQHAPKPDYAKTQQFIQFPEPKVCNPRDVQCRGKYSHKKRNPASF
uniref:Purple acid phosphatase n=1 Tax=Acrobeloides nanus TaxID=290746 RepID=A0A914C1C0_9BILA